jgi:alkanesulfonate monooxygenase SsuD/methylene tetrahydromethanopterin reductase-like flavin-dependent oxidoreductase (luciferase family)
MGIGVMLPISERSAFGRPVRFADMLEMTRVAEELGYDAVWLADHFLFRAPVAPEGEEWGMWEVFTALAGLAQGTTRIQLGTLVACLGWRNPGILARMIETIEEIGDGRTVLGVGAGWHEPEYTAYGLPWDHRVSRFEEAIAILGDLLRTGASTRSGRFFSTDAAISRPRGPREASGGPPILVGSTGERMLRLTATHADAWNTVWHPDAAEVVPLLTKVDEACAEVGRDPATLVRTAGGNIALDGYTGVRPHPMQGDADAIAGNLAAFRDLGFRHYVAGIDPCTPKSLEQFARVLEKLDQP